jgi:septum site-determining protein MinD
LVRIIDVCSGKGGVGKTTVAANLGLALQNFGKKVAVVDCNLTTSHLGLLFGFHNYPITLNNFLKGEARMEDII